MTKIPYFVADYYNREIVGQIIKKYGFEPLDAVRRFLCSETHRLLEDAENGLWEYPAFAVLEMWEAEQITGDPRNAACLRAY